MSVANGMDAILVDQVTAVYVVLAVAMVVFGGLFAYLWRQSAASGRASRSYLLGLAKLVVLFVGFGAMAAFRLVTSVDVALWLVMAAVLVLWLGLFYYLWTLDRGL